MRCEKFADINFTEIWQNFCRRIYKNVLKLANLKQLFSSQSRIVFYGKARPTCKSDKVRASRRLAKTADPFSHLTIRYTPLCQSTQRWLLPSATDLDAVYGSRRSCEGAAVAGEGRRVRFIWRGEIRWLAIAGNTSSILRGAPLSSRALYLLRHGASAQAENYFFMSLVLWVSTHLLCGRAGIASWWAYFWAHSAE